MKSVIPTYTDARRPRLDGRAKRSILLASRESLPRVEEILLAIEPHGLTSDVEVIVVRSFTDRELSKLATRYPWARLVPATDASDYRALRRTAVAASDGDILDILQDDRVHSASLPRHQKALLQAV